MRIQETISVDFQELSKHGIFRNIPVKYKTKSGNNLDIRFKLISVTDENGIPYPSLQSQSGDDIEVKIGDPDRTISGEITYVVTYEVQRVITEPSGETELYWNVTGLEWPVPIVSTIATVIAPEGAMLDSICFTGTYGSELSNCVATNTSSTATFSTELLDHSEGLTIAVMLDKDKFIFPNKLQELIWFLQDNWLYLTPLLVFVLMFRLYLLKGRDDEYLNIYHDTGIVKKSRLFAKVNSMQAFGPPKDLSPGEVGVLADERVDMRDITAISIDLARRGFYNIKETEKGIFKKASFTLTNNSKAEAELHPFEVSVLDMLFGKSRLKQVSLDKLPKTSYKYLDQAKKDLYEHITETGHFNQNPQSVRSKYLVIGIVILFFSLSFLAPLLAAISGNEAGAFIALIGSSIIIIGFSFFMPARSAKGRKALAEIVGLKEWLKLGAWREKIHEKHNFLEEVLPYTIAFALTGKFLKAFNEADLKNLSWYQSNHVLNSAHFIRSINSFGVSTAHAVSSTRPKSSASSGGSGFGGGGFSGGGFGGGGGGSW